MLCRTSTGCLDIDGNHYDDLSDIRPGRRAAMENGVRSPLVEAGLGKKDIQELSRAMSLHTWNRAPSPCLASRIPYGTPVTAEILRSIEAGESYLHNMGIGQVRLRHYGDTARIEVLPEDMPRLLDDRARVPLIEHLTSLGYNQVTLDLKGYRSGYI